MRMQPPCAPQQVRPQLRTGLRARNVIRRRSGLQGQRPEAGVAQIERRRAYDLRARQRSRRSHVRGQAARNAPVRGNDTGARLEGKKGPAGRFQPPGHQRHAQRMSRPHLKAGTVQRSPFAVAPEEPGLLPRQTSIGNTLHGIRMCGVNAPVQPLWIGPIGRMHPGRDREYEHERDPGPQAHRPRRRAAGTAAEHRAHSAATEINLMRAR